jgi:integrase
VVTGDECRAYVKQRSTPSQARRELEDLRAAINHHRQEGLHDRIVSVVLPTKGQRRERWLERDEAALLIRKAWRYREVQTVHKGEHKGDKVTTDRRTRRHVARFMVVARYMGSRASVICGASIDAVRPGDGPWVDLRNGVFYGRGVDERELKKRKQTVRIPVPLLAHMRRWRAAGQGYVVEWRGEPVLRVTKGHNATVADAGLGAEVTPHIWRHTVATWLMQAGADPWKAAGFLGMTVETLLRVYGHHSPDHSAEVHDALRNRHRRLSVAA